ncbi:MAG: trimethylamine methyltransferase family protein [Anaerolineae bacterium]|jgi:trimethylamine--corrinoid protein Co-methyltransferase
MYSETPKLQPITSAYHIRILSHEQLDQFKGATLEILADVGIQCPSEQAMNIYAEHGAEVDFDSQIVKLPPDVVLNSLSHAPRYYTMGARLPAFDLELDGSTMYCATDGSGTETIDFVTRERRSSVKDDVAKTARLADYLPSMAFYWPMVSAQDHPATAPLHELDASFNNTVKHVQTETVMGEKSARYAIEMAQVIAGDEATLRARPPLSLLVCTIAPLAHDKDGMESALAFAEAGLPVGFMSMATAGSTAPATINGTIVVADAEMVSAMVLIQMAHPGAPIYHSMMPGVMHPQTGAFLGGAWKAGLFYPIGVELAHMWGVPTLAGIGTEAPAPNWESAVGLAAGTWLCALCGAETASGLGLRETCTLLYPEALVLDVESYYTALDFAASWDTPPETFALDVIKEIGPRGHFLAHKHTREQMHKWELSELINRPDGKGGYRDPIEMAREKTEWILENHHPQPLEDAQQAELTRILGAAEDELRGR